MKILDIFLIFPQNIHCCRGGYNEHPQSMFWSKNKTINITGIPLQIPFFLYISGVQGGILFMDIVY